MTERTPVVTVFLRNRGEVLLFCRSETVGSYTGQWGAVAGHVTTDEGVTRDPETAARAERREETGLSEEAVTLVRAGDPFDVDDGDRQWRVHPFVFDGDRRNVTTNEETDEHEGCPPTEILRRETVPRLWTSCDRVRPGVETVAEDTEHGSAYLSYRALECLRDEAALRVEGQASGEVHEVAIALREARPAMAVLANRVNRAMSDAGDPTDHHPSSLDPFVLFERFHIDPDAGVPTHPHRGFEIVSYMLEGGMEHADSLGVTHTADESDAMCITTGGGIRHSEFPADGRACSGLQLWVNLPRDEKDIEADYEDASAAELSTREVEGATVTTVLGEGSPLSLRTPVEYRDVRLDGGGEWTWEPPEGRAGFCYGVARAGTLDGDAFGEGDVLVTETARPVRDENADGMRFVALAGRPHGEPIRQRGPSVL
jgi:redox-sensitive bicupin YhaK (pirin superfamily)/ADP-ribose pyrophosphatase YjhB (NUDIX family)